MHRIRTSVLTLSLAICAAAASAAHLTKDPLTQLPLPASTESPIGGNDPMAMPSAKICQSQYRGNYYSLSGTMLDSAIAWYVGALKGFRHIQSADHSKHMFTDAQRSLVVIVSGKAGGRADSVAYEKFEPGLPEKALLGFLTRAIDCT